MNGLAAAPLPYDRRLALVGNANGGDAARADPRLVDGLARGRPCVAPDILGIRFDPARRPPTPSTSPTFSAPCWGAAARFLNSHETANPASPKSRVCMISPTRARAVEMPPPRWIKTPPAAPPSRLRLRGRADLWARLTD